MSAASAKTVLSVTDSRTGRTYEIPITDGAISAVVLGQIKVSRLPMSKARRHAYKRTRARTRSLFYSRFGRDKALPLSRPLFGIRLHRGPGRRFDSVLQSTSARSRRPLIRDALSHSCSSTMRSCWTPSSLSSPSEIAD